MIICGVLPHWLGLTWSTGEIAGSHDELLPSLYNQRQCCFCLAHMKLLYLEKIIATSQGWCHGARSLPHFASYCYDEDHDQKRLWGGKGYVIWAHWGTPRQYLKQRPWRTLLADLLSLLSSIIQDQQPRGATTLRELGPPTYILSQENTLQAFPIGTLREAYS